MSKKKKLPSIKELKQLLKKQVAYRISIQDSKDTLGTVVLGFEVENIPTHEDIKKALKEENKLKTCLSLKLEINKLQKELRDFKNRLSLNEKEFIQNISRKENVNLIEATYLNQEMSSEQIQFFNAYKKGIEEKIKLKKAALQKLL